MYGIYIENAGKEADAITQHVTVQTCYLLNLNDREVVNVLNESGPTVFIKHYGRVILSVFEGCNGINVMIVFVAFMVAFGGAIRKLVWFIPLGLVVIHLANLGRLFLLYVTAVQSPRYFYYFHKYFFTAILYLIVLALWAAWVILIDERRISGQHSDRKAN
jgi:exosortase family protein XrtF